MENQYLLLNELVLLVVVATFPVWLFVTLVQILVYRFKGFDFTKYRKAFLVSLVVCFFLISLIGLLAWVVVPYSWYEMFRVFESEGYFPFLHSFILFPPMVLGALASAPFVSYFLLRRQENA